MNVSLFDYRLPQDLIAQKPVSPRDSCNLMVVEREHGSIKHKTFSGLPVLLRAGDVLVFNDSKVIPARIMFDDGGRKTEIFLTKRINATDWLAIGKPGKRLKKGAFFNIRSVLKAEILDVRPDGQRLIRFSPGGGRFDLILKKVGASPLPPYIRDPVADDDDYQTVFASKKGSVAAPTAGLHFTKRLLGNLQDRGIELQFVTLHVGLGTFQPLKTENVREHKMHGEFYGISEKTAMALNKARKEKRRIIAVGTTSVRVLESSFNGKVIEPGFGETSIYIYPGYRWRCVDGLITNFHLPKSTLLLLTCSFGGRKLILKAYKEAIRNKYRFYSFGDAMLIE